MPDLGDQVFLSPAMCEVRAQIRETHKELFALVEHLNELAHREMFATHLSNNNPQQLLVALLLHRALTTFQGVVILGEHGLQSEAAVLLRTLLEVLFRLVAIAKDAAVGIAYIREDERHREKFINKFKMLSDALKSAVGNPEIESLRAAIRQRIDDEDIRELKTQWFAERAGLEDFYHSAYSVFSGSVHVNVRDLEKALEVDAEGDLRGFNYGPSYRELAKLLLTAIESLILCLRGAFSVLPTASQVALDTVHREFTALHERLLPKVEI